MKDTKPKDRTRLDRWLPPFLFILLILFLTWGISRIANRDNQESVFLQATEKDCRKINGYLEKDIESRGYRLKQVFCWDSSGERLLFKKPMKYE